MDTVTWNIFSSSIRVSIRWLRRTESACAESYHTANAIKMICLQDSKVQSHSAITG